MSVNKTELDQYNQTASMVKILKTLHRGHNFDHIITEIEDDLLALFSAERFTIYKNSVADNMLVSHYKTGSDAKPIQLKFGLSSLAGFVGMTQKSLLIKNVYDNKELSTINSGLSFNGDFDQKSGFKSKSMIIVPIVRRDTFLGVLQIINKQDNAIFDEQDLKQAEEVSSLIGYKFAHLLNVTDKPFEYLVKKEKITEEKLRFLLKQAKEIADQASLIINEEGVSQKDVGESLEHFFQVPFLAFEPEKYWLHPLVKKFKAAYFKKNKFVFLTNDEKDLIVVTVDPKNIGQRRVIQSVIGLDGCSIHIGLIEDIDSYLEHFNSANIAAKNEESNKKEVKNKPETINIPELSKAEYTTTINRLLNRVLTEAQKLKASNIHLEPVKNSGGINVRMRIGKICQQGIVIPKSYASGFISRIKLMAKLEQDQKYSPQQGRFSIRLNRQAQNINVVSIPAVNGDSLVLHFVDMTQSSPFTFEQLNLSAENKTRVKAVLEQSKGLFLVAGTEKSGNSTVLHALLNELNTDDRKIWAVENEVTIVQSGVQHVQTNPLTGFDYKAALQSFLHADPDVILVGEIDDCDTMELVIDASSKEQLLLSAVQANSAAECIQHVLNLGVDFSRFANVLLGVLVQRAVKTLCSACKKEIADGEKEHLHELYGQSYMDELGDIDNIHLFEHVGCESCHHTGYDGNTMLHELFVTNDEFWQMIKENPSESKIKESIEKDNVHTLLQDGIQKLLSGQIDLAQLK